MMDLRQKMCNKTRIAIFGSSYIRRLDSWCNGDFKVPATVRCFGKGGMKASSVPEDILNDVFNFQPDIVFIQLGGNDISKSKTPSDLVGDLIKLVDNFKSAGVKQVYIGEILERGDFTKSPGVDITFFNSVRKFVNRRLVKIYGKHVINFLQVRFPRDYLDDKVHLNSNGLRTYYLKLRRLFLSLKC